MTINATCLACRRSVNAPDHLAGKRVKCPQCKNIIDIPADGSSTSALATQRRPSPLPPQVPDSARQQLQQMLETSPANNPKRKRMMWICIGVGAVVLIALSIGLVVALRGGARPNAPQPEELASFMSAFEQPDEEKGALSDLKEIVAKAEAPIKVIKQFQASIEVGTNYTQFTDKLSALIVAADEIKSLPSSTNERINSDLEILKNSTANAITEFKSASTFWKAQIGSTGGFAEFDATQRNKALEAGQRHANSAVYAFGRLQSTLGSPTNAIKPVVISNRKPGTYNGSNIIVLTQKDIGFSISGTVYRLPMSAREFEKIFGSPGIVERTGDKDGWIRYNEIGISAFMNSQAKITVVEFHVDPDSSDTSSGVKSANTTSDQGIRKGNSLDQVAQAHGAPTERKKAAYTFKGDTIETLRYTKESMSAEFIGKQGLLQSIWLRSKE